MKVTPSSASPLATALTISWLPRRSTALALTASRIPMRSSSLAKYVPNAPPVFGSV
jgi:hypothetical protein